MGLYDNVHAINSTKIPSFVADHSKEIGEYITQANQKHEATTGFMDATEEMLKNAPINSDDQENYANLLADAKTHLSTLSSRPSLADATGEAYRLARQVKDRLTPLVNRTAQEAAWHKELDARVLRETKDGGIDQITKQRAIEASRRMSTPIQLDANGRQVPGTGFIPIDVAPNIDKTAELKKFLDLIPEQKWADASEGDDGMLKTSNRAAYVDKLPNTIRQQFEGFIQNNKPWMAMNARDAMLATSEATAGVSNESVLQELNKIPDTPEKALWGFHMNKAMADGKSALEAYKIVTHADALNYLNAVDLNQALGGTKHDVDTGRTAGPGWQVEAEAKAKADAKVSDGAEDNWSLPNATVIDRGSKQTGRDLAENLDKFTTADQEYSTQIDNLSRTVTSKDPSIPLESKVEAQAKIADLKRMQKVNEINKQSTIAGKERLLEKATQEQYGVSWSQLKTLNASKVKKSLENEFVRGIETTGGIISIKDIVEDIASGNYNYTDSKKSSDNFSGSSMIPTSGGVSISTGITLRVGNKTIKGGDAEKVLNTIRKFAPELAAVRTKANSMAVAGTNIQGTQIALKENQQKVLNTALPTMQKFDINNGAEVNLDDKNIDWNKSSIGNYMPEMGLLLVNLDVDGKSTPLFVEPGEKFAEHRGNQLLTSSDANMRQIGKNMVLNNYETYRNTFNQGSGLITIHPITKDSILLNGTPVGIQRNSDGTFSLADPATATLIRLKTNAKDTEGKAKLNFGEITSILNNLLK